MKFCLHQIRLYGLHQMLRGLDGKSRSSPQHKQVGGTEEAAAAEGPPRAWRSRGLSARRRGSVAEKHDLKCQEGSLFLTFMSVTAGPTSALCSFQQPPCWG